MIKGHYFFCCNFARAPLQIINGLTLTHVRYTIPVGVLAVI